ncbi:hypothetical protein [Pseudoalteromonas luteoviolacea]|uniref:Uncharacterized protein n=1 Tax=Pseudoalteromonas luteoviolacea NCIMB 1942 TaxID=1365253 RepID=A0A167GN58_9GAMM|nr:hypothetical protein [Pseudoalteromonas luteoviolacea]KZN55837.1 hypothetical protein N482_05005 [Pseudoalteromonas luteoviolacea NCIMB 1942]
MSVSPHDNAVVTLPAGRLSSVATSQIKDMMANPPSPIASSISIWFCDFHWPKVMAVEMVIDTVPVSKSHSFECLMFFEALIVQSGFTFFSMLLQSILFYRVNLAHDFDSFFNFIRNI